MRTDRTGAYAVGMNACRENQENKGEINMSETVRKSFTIYHGGAVMRPEVMRHEGLKELVLLEYPALRETGMVKHCFTTRLGGVSEGQFGTLNLSFSRGDREEAVQENYRRVARALGVETSDMVCSDQTHTTNVRRVTRADAGCGVTRERSYHDVDGLITDEPGLVLATFYADCVPLYFVDRAHRAIGLSHSGWRGTVGRMGRHTLDAMKAAFGTEPEDVLCAVGPSICRDCYEVSGDVADEFGKAFGKSAQNMLFPKGGGKYQLDLWEANRQVLLEAGVPENQIILPTLCTCCNHQLLFSHRATNGKRGNLGAFLCIK